MEVAQRTRRRSLVEALAAFALFCAISALSRLIAPLFFLMVVSGIAFPLVWAKRHHNWSEIGFRRENAVKAILWGVVVGLAIGIYTYLVFGMGRPIPDMVGLQLMVGTPIWLLIMSPFQEFFFRGWLQPGFQKSIGKWKGLFLTSACFTVWHFCPPFQGTSTSIIPIASAAGVFSTFLLGIVFGYIFQRHGNILAPWMAHALAGIAAVAMGLMSFLQYSP